MLCCSEAIGRRMRRDLEYPRSYLRSIRDGARGLLMRSKVYLASWNCHSQLKAKQGPATRGQVQREYKSVSGSIERRLA